MAKKQSKSSIAAAAPTTATTTATSPDAPAQSQGSSATTKALPRGPHTLQLVFHLLIHSLLLLLTTLVLPSHLLTRSSSDTTTTHLSFLSSTAYLFRLPATEENAALLKKCMWGGVQGVVLIQGWALMRFRKWWELGEAIESGDRVKAQDVNKRGWAKSAEVRVSSKARRGQNAGAEVEISSIHQMLTLSSVSLPATFAIVQALLILVGAPAIKDVTATAQLSLAVTLLIGFPLLHLVSNDMDHWTRLLGVVRCVLRPGLHTATPQRITDPPHSHAQTKVEARSSPAHHDILAARHCFHLRRCPHIRSWPRMVVDVSSAHSDGLICRCRRS